MPRTALIALLACAALTAAGSSVAAPPADPAAARASARVAECDRATHQAVFAGRMRRVRGARRMAMRFTLLERAGRSFRPVEVDALSRWRKSKKGVGVFRYRQVVAGLREGGAYRSRVDFRWLGARGKVVRRERRRSGVCRQFDAVPNLRIADLRVARGGELPPGVWRYRVEVENSGRANASNVGVRLAVDRSTVDTATVPALAAGQRTTVEFTGPACDRGSSPVRATADPDGAIMESREDDNSRARRCSRLTP